VPFTLNFLENTYDSVKLTENTQIKYNLEKANTNTAKQNYPGSVALRLGCSNSFLLATKLMHKKTKTWKSWSKSAGRRKPPTVGRAYHKIYREIDSAMVIESPGT